MSLLWVSRPRNGAAVNRCFFSLFAIYMTASFGVCAGLAICDGHRGGDATIHILFYSQCNQAAGSKRVAQKMALALLLEIKEWPLGRDGNTLTSQIEPKVDGLVVPRDQAPAHVLIKQGRSVAIAV